MKNDHNITVSHTEPLECVLQRVCQWVVVVGSVGGRVAAEKFLVGSDTHRISQGRWTQARCRANSAVMKNRRGALRNSKSILGTPEMRAWGRGVQLAHVLHKGGGGTPRAGRCPPWEWQQGRDQPTAHGTVHVVRRFEILVQGGRRVGQEGVRDRGTRSANRQGEEQHRHTEHGSHTRRDKCEHSRQGGGAQRGRRGNQNSGNREPEWRGWGSVRMGGSDNKGDGLASQPRRYRVPGQSLLNRHQVGGVSRSPDGLFAQQEREPIRGRPAVRGKRTYGGRLGRRVEEQGTCASRTQKHSKAGYGRPVDRGAWTAKTVKRSRQQPAHPQYANYWAPLTHKRHTMPHSAQPQHTNYWAPQTRKRHQQEHQPQRPAESSNLTQHAKGRMGDCPGPCKGTTTRRNATQGAAWDSQQTHSSRNCSGLKLLIALIAAALLFEGSVHMKEPE